MRWLGDKSLLAHKPCPLDGCPRFAPAYLGRKDGGEAPTKAFVSRSRFSYPWSESMRKKPFSTQVRWCEPGAPVQGEGLAGSRESGGERTANRLTELKSFFFSLAIGESAAPNEQPAWRPKQGKRHALVGRQISACSQALPPGRVPQVRTSVPGKKRRGRSPHQSFYIQIKVQLPLEFPRFAPAYLGRKAGRSPHQSFYLQIKVQLPLE